MFDGKPGLFVFGEALRMVWAVVPDATPDLIMLLRYFAETILISDLLKIDSDTLLFIKKLAQRNRYTLVFACNVCLHFMCSSPCDKYLSGEAKTILARHSRKCSGAEVCMLIFVFF